MIKAIPNLFTLANLVCGCLGIVCAFNLSLEWSGYFIGIAAIFDFFDGFAARVLNAKSEIGKQLDSLADMVTFGALPGIILFQLISISFGEYFVPISLRPFDHVAWESIGFLVPVFSALRLAKFNIDESQSDTFIGMPTPAVAIFVASLPVILQSLEFNYYHPLAGELLGATARQKYWGPLDFYTVGMFQDFYFLLMVSLILSLMMVAPVRMIALKFKGISWSNNKSIYIFLLMALGLIVVAVLPYVIYLKYLPDLGLIVIPLIIVLYAMYSVLNGWVFGRK